MRKEFKGKVTKNTKVYKEPIISEDYEVSELKVGEVVHIDLKDGEFYLIYHGNKIAYVSVDNIKLDSH